MAHNVPRPLVLAVIPVLSVLTASWADPAAAGTGGFRAGGVGFAYSTGSHADGERPSFEYALVLSGNELQCVLEGDKSAWQTIGDLEREVERTRQEVFWFARDGRQYVIRDRATVERVHDILEPTMRLGAEQGRLGAMQGELGAKQGEYGALQGRLGSMQGRLANLDIAGDPRYESDYRELRRQIDEISQRVRELGVQQRALGAQQQELGRRQRELGAQQRRASALAWDQLHDLTEQAIAKGTAEAVDGN